MRLFKLLVFCSLTAAFLIFLTGCSQIEPYDGPAADLVIKNAKIVTIDDDKPRAEAIAIKGELIIGVTNNKSIDQYIEEGVTQVVDAEGRCVIPGFNDAHAHYGSINLDNIDLRYITDPNEITRRVAERVKEVEPGVLISGGRWEHEMFTNRQWPTKELLDKVAPDNPVSLSRADGHSVLVNSYIIKASGITKDMPNPFGGEIQKDPVTGEPTGIFKESAKGLLRYERKRPEYTPEEREARNKKSWDEAFNMAKRLGVTSIQFPPGGSIERYEEFMQNGELPFRVYIGGRLTANEGQLQRYAELRDRYPLSNDWIRFGYLKGFIDGTLGSGTALFFEPFEDEPDKTGLPQMEYEELEKRIVASDAMGFQIGIHAIGSKANNWILNAFEKAQEVNGERDSRHRSEHAQILIDDDIPRFAELGVIASMQPTHCITDKRFCEKRIGLERSRGAYAWRRLLDANAKIAFGTDYSVEPLEPLEGLFAAVTRKDRFDKDDPSWFPDQCLSMEEAIELYTLGSAYAEFMEDRKGMLKVGYLADLLIFERDLMTMPHDEIMSNRVDYTIVGGKVVFKRDGAK
ncbi:amidohydrolase [candidate division KSB1 bacterium]